jgi:hypothetical protein
MHFSSFLAMSVLACTATAAATPSYPGLNHIQLRAVANFKEINDTFNKIGDKIDLMIDQINKWDETATTMNPIITSSHTLLQEIKTGTTVIQKTSTVGMFDLANVVGAVGYLAIHVNDISKVMINKKEKFDAIGKTDLVKTEMIAQRAASDDLGKAILSKLPSWTMEAAKPVTESIIAKLGSVVDAYNLPAKPVRM